MGTPETQHEPLTGEPASRGRYPPPVIVPRSGHRISRSGIDPNALKVLYRLHGAGYAAYLVGGGVRDLLLGLEPKDFDIATDARPEDVRRLFRNCRLIGRRFRLAHVFFGPEIVEVATFRAHGDGEDEGERVVHDDGRLVRDNVYGTLDEDAWRRDFTVNALYYNIADYSLVDFTGGLADIEAGVLRLIGEPGQRYPEDPVRMLRAVRLAVKLGFLIEPAAAAAIPEQAALLRSVAPARLFDEVLKMFHAGCAVQTFEALRHHGLFGELFPEVDATLDAAGEGFASSFIVQGLEATDRRVAEGKPVTPAFLFGVLLWEPVRRLFESLVATGMAPLPAMLQASAEVVDRQLQSITLPRRFSLPMREIWMLQPRFLQRTGGRPARHMGHPRFRAAYDFLLLRAACGEVDPSLAEWWTAFIEADTAGREALLASVVPESGAGGKKRRRGRRGRKKAAE